MTSAHTVESVRVEIEVIGGDGSVKKVTAVEPAGDLDDGSKTALALALAVKAAGFPRPYVVLAAAVDFMTQWEAQGPPPSKMPSDREFVREASNLVAAWERHDKSDGGK